MLVAVPTSDSLQGPGPGSFSWVVVGPVEEVLLGRAPESN
jgi:hypothetical protein